MIENVKIKALFDIHSLAILSTALLFGGMTLYSFGFAAFLFYALPAATAGQTLRKALPWFYGFVIVTASLAAAFWWFTASVLQCPWLLSR